MIQYGRQDITEEDVRAVVAVLRSDHLTQGPTVPAFEAAMAGYCGAAAAVATNSATSALHLACLGLEVGEGDRVWTSPVTFVATANSARFCGAEIDFVDVEPDTGNLDAGKLRHRLVEAAREQRLPKVVIPVHLGGQPCDMAAIHTLGQEFGFRIIEDAAHAIGSRYRDAPVGDCRYSDLTVFSFHPVKVMTTGEGGLVTTRDPALARRLRRLRSHGVSRDEAEFSRPPDGPWHYEQIELGYNYRMTEIQAALGLSQLRRLDAFVEKRHELAGRYDDALRELPVHTPARRADRRSALHLYAIRLDLNECRATHRQVFEGMRSAGVGVALHYMPLYRHPIHRRPGRGPEDFPGAEQYYASTMTLPLHVGLTAADQRHVIETLRSLL
jgi:UDP-4-amino-4,6-dideoxy-N-acetyl-beta-L-altrosamine transaminase